MPVKKSFTLSGLVFLFLTNLAHSECEHWQWQNPVPDGHSIKAVATNDSVIVAVGHQGIIQTSDNGTDWDAIALSEPHVLTDIIWTGSDFVGVGEGGTIIISQNGENWSPLPFPETSRISAIAYDGSRMVVASEGAVWESSNLDDWTIAESFSGHVVNDIDSDGDRFFLSGTDGLIAESNDGLAWTERDAGTNYNLYSVAIGDDSVVAVAGFAAFSTSDGVAWTETSVNFASPGRIFWTGDEFRVPASSGLLYTSVDGEQWSLEALPSKWNLKDTLSTSVGDIVVGDGGSKYWREDADWQVVGSVRNVAGLNTPYRMASNGDSIVMTDFVDRIFKSDDGMQWDNVLTLGSGNGTYVVYTVNHAFNKWYSTAWNFMSGDTHVLVSDDAEEWDVHDVPEVVRSATTNGDVIVAVGSGIFSSDDGGVSWSAHGSVTDETLAHVAWIDGAFYAVSFQGSVVASPDGENWTERHSGSGAGLFAIAGNGSRLVASGGDTTLNEGVTLTSDDGIEWSETRHSDTTTVSNVKWDSDISQFVALGYDGEMIYMRSDDGISWSKQAIPTNWQLITHERLGNRVVVAGTSGVILANDDVGEVFHDRFETCVP